MGDGKQELVELQGTKICTLELSVPKRKQLRRMTLLP